MTGSEDQRPDGITISDAESMASILFGWGVPYSRERGANLVAAGWRFAPTPPVSAGLPSPVVEEDTAALACPGDDSCVIPEHWPDPASGGPHRGERIVVQRGSVDDEAGRQLTEALTLAFQALGWSAPTLEVQAALRVFYDWPVLQRLAHAHHVHWCRNGEHVPLCAAVPGSLREKAGIE